jgi:N-acetylglucosaminyldiphosphoundecaprenol N-acetyl-beta-D-mannosaminyltransferase
MNTVSLLGMELARLTQQELLDHIFAGLQAGKGGWLVTANLDFLRRYKRDPSARALYDASDLRVVDGKPLEWASRIKGSPVPERLAGASLLEPIVARAAEERRSVFFLGGAGQAAEAAKRLFVDRYPTLRMGHHAPMISSPPSEEQVASTIEQLRAFSPDILLVGLGSPKQEQLIHRLRSAFPRTWMVGVGISFSFASGEVARAPRWMQNSGLEWVHRLIQEPRRLARRYLVDDLPFAFILLFDSLWSRSSHSDESAP